MNTPKETLIAVTKADIRINFNNKGLKMLFPGTVVTKKKLELGEMDSSVLSKYIKSSELSKKYDGQNFSIEDIDLEGQFGNWDLVVKLKVY
jgi:hypothetical protein